MRLRRYSHLQLHVAVPAYSQVTRSVRVMQHRYLPVYSQNFASIGRTGTLSLPAVILAVYLQLKSSSSKRNIKLYSRVLFGPSFLG
jgi:hypothetical protein